MFKNKNFYWIIVGLIIVGIIIIVIPYFKFGCKGSTLYFLDTYSAENMITGYNWFDEDDPDSHELHQGHLKIIAGLGQDLWTGKGGAPLLLRPTPTCNYKAETFVRAGSIESPNQSLNTQMGLFAFEDKENFLFFGLTNHSFTDNGILVEQDGLIVTKTDNNVSSIIDQIDFDKDLVYLQITKRGNDWKFHWREERTDPWTLLATTNMAMPRHKTGPGVKTFDLFPEMAGPANGYFDYLLFKNAKIIRF